MSQLKTYYTETVVPKLKDKFNYTNPMQIPKIEKIVLNMGLGEAIHNIKIIDSAVAELKQIFLNNLAELSEVEQRVIRERFAMGPIAYGMEAAPKTLEQVGNIIGVTKERVRQIQNKALRKSRVALEEGYLAA